MGLIIERTAADQVFTGVSLVLMGVVIMPFAAALLLQAMQKLNMAAGTWSGVHLSFANYMRYFFLVGAAAFAVLGVVRLTVYVAVVSGLLGSPWERAG